MVMFLLSLILLLVLNPPDWTNIGLCQWIITLVTTLIHLCRLIKYIKRKYFPPPPPEIKLSPPIEYVP